MRYIGHAIGSFSNVADGQGSNSVLRRLSDIQDSLRAVLSFFDSATPILPSAPESGLRVAPATILDTSQHFFPEIYTLESQILDLCMMTIDAYEEYSDADTRRNVYKCICQKSPRQWQWLTIYIEVHLCSKYWSVTRITRSARKWANPVLALSSTLPHSLITCLPSLLDGLDRL